MAVLQKIRNKGKFLVGIVGLALFAFIAEEAVRSFQSTANENRQKVGEVYGESLSVQEFGAMVDEYADFVKLARGMSQLDEQSMAQLRDEVWQTYVQNKIIEHECSEAGLDVTDAELQDIIAKGQSQWFSQLPFRGQDGGFDIAQLRQFLDQYEQMKSDPNQAQGEYFEQYTQIYKMWQFVEGRLRSEALAQKYISLLQGASLASNISAQAAFDARVNQSDVVLAAVPYNSIEDATIEVSDNDIKAKYNELKPLFKANEEMRSVEYISVKVVASQADRDALQNDLREVAATIGESTNLSKSVREAGSSVAYSSLPVSRKALPGDIAACVDTLQAGQIVGPFTSSDNTMNVVRLVKKVQQPDSVEMRQIFVAGADMAAARKTADSIVAAVKAGTPFDTIAAQQNQQGAATWLTGRQYEGQALDADNTKYLAAILEMAAGATEVVELTNGYIVVNVTDRRAMTDKYDVAIVKRAIDFSRDTYNEAYNNLSRFLSENKTANEIRENATKKNYRLMEEQLAPSSHRVANVSSTRDALRWVFNEDTDKDDVSPLYECGENDNLLVVVLKSISPKGFVAPDNENVNPYLRSEIIKDKKAAQLQEQMAGKTIAQVAKMHGAKMDTVRHISFAGNVYIPALGASERCIAGALVGKQKGDVAQAVKGDAAVYTMEVIGTNKSVQSFNADQERNQLGMTSANAVMQGMMQKLVEQANVVDHRYLFY